MSRQESGVRRISILKRNVSKPILFGLSLLTCGCSSARTGPTAPSIPASASAAPSAASSSLVGTAAPSLRIAPGDCVLTIAADATCTGISADLRKRTFAATITPLPDRPNARWVDISGSFLGPVGLSLEVVGANHLDTIDGLGFFERFPSFTYLYIPGSPTAWRRQPERRSPLGSLEHLITASCGRSCVRIPTAESLRVISQSK